MLKERELVPYALTDVESARDALQVKTDDYDMMLVDFINRASLRIENHCNRHFIRRDWVFVLDGNGQRDIILPEYPVASLASIAFTSGDHAEWTDLDIAGWHCDEVGILFTPNDRFPRGTANIRVTAACGMLATDAEFSRVRGACELLVQDYFQRFINQAGSTQAQSAGSLSVTWTDDGARLPDHVRSELSGLVRVAF